jgi:cyclopropane-fatty-acyl-phospholipid synthase
MSAITLAEYKLLPDSLVRFGIKKLLKQRLQDEYANDPEHHRQRYETLLENLRQSAIAIETGAANAQHYEVPAAFYKYALGKHLKYSSCFWDEQTENLDQAEVRMLAITAERAELADGQQILELGCGWGSLTLWMAEHFPASCITAVSNSNSQREYIQQQAKQRGFKNIEVITCDVNQLTLDKEFDRIVSVEMFEHMRNYESLLSKIAGWLKADGKLFVHIFCHKKLAYPFETEGDDNWMGRYFFTGGLMPARDTLLHFQKDLQLQYQWDLSGSHYQKTAEAWLTNMDQYRKEIGVIFNNTYGKKQAGIWQQRWRIFFMSCSELFGYSKGDEWQVAHYVFIKKVMSKKAPPYKND